MMRLLLGGFLLLTVVSVVFANVTKENLSDIIQIKSPLNGQLIDQKTIKVSGKVPVNSKLNIGKQSLKVKENGQFSGVISVSDIDNNRIPFDILTDTHSIQFDRSVTILTPGALSNYSEDGRRFIQSEYVGDFTKKAKSSAELKKYHFAYFLNQISNKSTVFEKKIADVDAQTPNQYQIQSIVNKGVLVISKNGHFYPEKPINLMIFLAGVSKALALPKSTTNYPELNRFKEKWFHSVLAQGMDAGIISGQDLSQLTRPLSLKLFAKYGARVPVIRTNLTTQQALVGNVLGDSLVIKARQRDFPNQSESSIRKISTNKKAITPIVINLSGVDHTESWATIVSGRGNPPQNFVVNFRRVTVDEFGYFVLTIPKNSTSFLAEFKDQRVDVRLVDWPNLTNTKSSGVIKKISLPKIEVMSDTLISKKTEQQFVPYADLTNHWVKVLANRLKREGKLDASLNFYPKQLVNRQIHFRK